MRTFFGVPPLVAVLRGATPATVGAAGAAIADAGFMIIEVTMNSPAPLESLRILGPLERQGVIVGAGTVTKPEEVDSVAAAGARIIVSPNANEAVIRQTKSRGLISLPGCFTPTEAFAALEAGADGLKLFPGELLSARAVKALKAVLPEQFPLFVVGGVGADNMEEYAAAGATGFGVGSALFRAGKPIADIRRDAEIIFRRFVSLSGGGQA